MAIHLVNRQVGFKRFEGTYQRLQKIVTLQTDFPPNTDLLKKLLLNGWLIPFLVKRILIEVKSHSRFSPPEGRMSTLAKGCCSFGSISCQLRLLGNPRRLKVEALSAAAASCRWCRNTARKSGGSRYVA